MFTKSQEEWHCSNKCSFDVGIFSLALPLEDLLVLSEVECDIMWKSLSSEERAKKLSLLPEGDKRRLLDEMDLGLRGATEAAEKLSEAAAAVKVPHLESYKSSSPSSLSGSAKDQLAELRARCAHLESFLTKQNKSIHVLEGVVKTKHRDQAMFSGNAGKEN